MSGNNQVAYDKRVSIPLNAQCASSLHYNELWSSLNTTAANFLHFLESVSPEITANPDAIVDAINEYCKAVFTGDDELEAEAKRMVYGFAAQYGIDIYASDFQEWVNGFAYSAYLLKQAEKEILLRHVA